MKQILFSNYEDLIKRLYEAGLHPGDEICNEAARVIEELLRKIQYENTYDQTFEK